MTQTPYVAPYGGYGPMRDTAPLGDAGAAGGFMDSRMRNNSDIYDNVDRDCNIVENQLSKQEGFASVTALRRECPTL
ncbi:hypothetical protein KEM52_005140 [Ascosphaera acerosa]|nr:hypothetical protein KEM52_005140 [Ascosphaera acerosa]